MCRWDVCPCHSVEFVVQAVFGFDCTSVHFKGPTLFLFSTFLKLWLNVCFHGSTLQQIAYHVIWLIDKALRETLDQVLLSGYFDRVPAHQNGVCEEEEEEEAASAAAAAVAAAAAAAAAESSEAEEQTVDPGLWSHAGGNSPFLKC